MHMAQNATYLDSFEFVVHGICLTSVGLAGLLANIVCLLVLKRPALKCGRQGSVNFLLTSMAAIDFLLLLSSVLLFGLPAIIDHLRRHHPNESDLVGQVANATHHILQHMTPWTYAIAMEAQTASVYITVVVTVERWLAVCYPLLSRSICSRGRARKAVLVVVAFSFLYNITRFFEYKCTTEYTLTATDLRMNEHYKLWYITVMYMLVMYVAPLILLVGLNIRIGVTIHKARLQRNSIVVKPSSSEVTRSRNEFVSLGSSTRHNPSILLNGSRRDRDRLEENEQQNLAIMLMVVVLIFVLCNVLAMVSNILETLNFNAGALTKISNLLVTLNSSVNLFIYCGFGRKFRREFKKLFHLREDGGRNEATILRRYWSARQDHQLPAMASDNDSVLILGNDNINMSSEQRLRNSHRVQIIRPNSYFSPAKDH